MRRVRSRAVVLAAVVVLVLIGAGLVLRQLGPDGSGSSPSAPDEADPLPAVPSFGATGVPREQQSLLDESVGFGGGVTGGAGGELVRVGTDRDSGPGSLREAVAGDAVKWVTFDTDMTIVLTEPIEVGSNTTIDARGRDVTLSAPGTSGLLLRGVSNVIVESMTMRMFGDVTGEAPNDKSDAIHIDGAHGVWINHNDLSRAGDKLIGVTGESWGITISWNHFHDQEQTLQLGNQSTRDDSARQTVTVHHNFFDRVGYRMPVVSYGRAHVFNNYYLDWDQYAVRSQRDAEVYLEDNLFVGERSDRTVRTNPSGNGCNDAETRCDDRPGTLREEGNLVENARRIRETAPQSVFDPSDFYEYQSQPGTESLAASVRRGAGPR